MRVFLKISKNLAQSTKNPRKTKKELRNYFSQLLCLLTDRIAVFGSYVEIISREFENYIMDCLYYYSYVSNPGDAVIVPFPGVQTCPDGEKRLKCPL